MGVHIPVHKRVVGNSSLLYKPVRNIPVAGQTYAQKVLGYGPIAYWPLWETSGTTAECLVNSAQNGTYNSDVSTWPVGDGIGDGNTAPQFDGTNDYIPIWTATFRDAFNGEEGTFAAWAKVSGAGVWTDGSHDYICQLYVDADNSLYIRKTNVNNQLLWQYEANNTTENVTTGGHSDTGWMHFALTWSKSADQVKAYKNGAQEGATQTGLGAWAGQVINGQTNIGCWSGGVNPWNGSMAHVAVWDRALSLPDIQTLATV